MNNIVSLTYNEDNDIWGNPQEYLKVKFYPLKLKDSHYKKLFYQIFCYPKNSIQEKDILKMSYLKFLVIVLAGSNHPNLLASIVEFIQHVTQEDTVEIQYAEDKNIPDDFAKINLKLLIGETEFTEQDFDNIREIILEQNGTSIEYIEAYNSELEAKLYSFNNRGEDLEFKDEIFAFCSLLGRTIDETSEYTLWQYKYHIEKLLLLEEYRLYRPLEASGAVTLKSGEIRHFLSASNRAGRYDSILISKESFKNTSDIFKV